MNIRKKFALWTTAILAVIYIAGATLAAIVYHTDPQAPEASVTAVSAEPDYRVTISWERVKNAYAYELEYRYTYEPEKTVKITTARTSLKIERIKGELVYRMRTVYNREKSFSEYSDWMTYYIEPLYLESAVQCNLNQYDQGVKFVMANWETQTFLYRGEWEYVDYYDCIAVGPGMDKDVEFEGQHNLETIPAIEIATTYFFNFPTGEWTVYYRPSICHGVLYNNKIYDEDLLKIYDETDVWTASTITVV